MGTGTDLFISAAVPLVPARQGSRRVAGRRPLQDVQEEQRVEAERGIVNLQAQLREIGQGMAGGGGRGNQPLRLLRFVVFRDRFQA